MTDYGHDLIFGTFITPTAQQSHDVVELAVASERAGVDLVTFQDHPYQPAFLDTWTLLSYVAARTERVRLSGNVLNLPLRLPSVLGRAAASLDLLSDGRFELALGAGAFWDAIQAMGGPRRQPGESVTALEEAIDVIRQIWSPEDGASVRVDGTQYRVVGAKRGPRPAHDVSIWLGALKPRMFRLIGRKADGWLPSLAYLGPGGLQRGNEMIDDAAAAAGRDPGEIRRMLNIGLGDDGLLGKETRDWPERLLPLVLNDGISGFIVAAEDPLLIDVWGGQVAPALREAVARERAAA